MLLLVQKGAVMERTRINPSLLIGLGGQGQKSLVEIRRRLEATYGCVPPQIKLMALEDLAALRDSLAAEAEKAKKSGDEQREQAFQRDVEAVTEFQTTLQDQS